MSDTSHLPVTILSGLADDFRVLASLHAVELEDARWQALRRSDFPNTLTLPPVREEAQLARAALAEELAERPHPDSAAWDAWAVDFAAIYVHGGYQCSPNESVWLDEEGLERQAPMFAVRQWYSRFGLEVGDWRNRPDDNLALELSFLAHLLETAEPEASVAQFLDDHLLKWLPRFAQRVAQRCESRFYAALALLTTDYVDTLRALLAEHCGYAFPAPPDKVASKQKVIPIQPQAFVPGMSPSW